VLGGLLAAYVLAPSRPRDNGALHRQMDAAQAANAADRERELKRRTTD